MTFWRTMGRSLRLRCPVCGVGKVFSSLFLVTPSCSGCGLDFRREQGYYIGAMYINYGLTTAVMIGVGVPLAGRVSNAALLWPLGTFGVVFPLLFFRYSRSLWLGLDLYFTSLI